MKTFITTLLLLAVTSFATADDETGNPLSPYAPLAGHCWQGTFPDGKATDEHCFTWVYGGWHLRDVHVVRGGDGAYRGESIYSWDAKRERIVYRYWNSQGGYSDGEIIEVDGELVSPEERYTDTEGREQVFRSRLRIVGPDTYEASTDMLQGGEWKQAWKMTFRKSAAAVAQ